MTDSNEQPLLRRTLSRMDEAWTAFQGRMRAVPVERLATRIAEGEWTIKEMVAHVGAWHDLTIDRLARFAGSGEPAELADEADVINARAARAAGGRTTGEILMSVDDSYRRLRREVARLTDDQLAAHDAWAASIIAGNTYDHYAEHLDDLRT
jgi:hypothetical protein